MDPIAWLTYFVPSSQDLLNSFPHDKYVAIALDKVQPVPCVFLVVNFLVFVFHYGQHLLLVWLCVAMVEVLYIYTLTTMVLLAAMSFISYIYTPTTMVLLAAMCFIRIRILYYIICLKS